MAAARLVIWGLFCLTAGCQTLQDYEFEPLAGTPAPVPTASATPAGDVDSTETAGEVSTAIDPRQASTSSVVEPASYEQPPEAVPLELLAPVEPADSPNSDLSLAELEQIALANHPALAQAAAQVAALRGSWVQEGLPPNPMVGYMADEIGDDGTAGMQGGYVSQQFITGGKLGLSRAVAAQQIAVAEQRFAATQQRVLTDVRTGFYDVLIAQRQLDLARELVNISHEAVETSGQLLAAREIPRIGLLQTEVEAGNALILLRRAENEYAAAWRRLTSVIGIPDLQRARVGGDLNAAAIAMDFEDQLARLAAQSPELAAAVTEVAQARWALDRARAQVVPDVFTQVAVQYNNASGDTVTGVQVGVPLPLWNKNQGGIMQARQEVIAAARNVGRVQLDLRQRLADVFQQYADASVQVETYSTNILPRARETLELVTTGYRAGEIGYLDLLTAQRTYFQTALAYVEALRGLWRARLLIEGLLLSGSLQGGSTPE